MGIKFAIVTNWLRKQLDFFDKLVYNIRNFGRRCSEFAYEKIYNFGFNFTVVI